MNNPLVTVFITVYNSEEYIRECLESVLNQTYENLEILIIDDGSVDETNSIIRSYEDSRIRLITNDKNMGIPYNRIKGVESAKGQYLAILDSDDISMLNRIEKQVEFMERNLDILAAGTYFKAFGKKLNNRVYKFELDSKEMQITLMFKNPILNSSSIIRLNKIKQLNINYNSKYFIAQDYGLWAEISKVGKIINMPEVLVKYRFGHNNITKLTNQQKALQRKGIIDSIHNDLIDYYEFNLTSSEKEIFNQFFDENEPILDKPLINNAKKVFTKMKNINREKKIFDVLVFERILNSTIESSIKWSSINLIDRVTFWHELSDKRLSYIISKSVYFSLRSSIKKIYKILV